LSKTFLLVSTFVGGNPNFKEYFRGFKDSILQKKSNKFVSSCIKTLKIVFLWKHWL